MTTFITTIIKKEADTNHKHMTCNYANNYYGDQMCTSNKAQANTQKR